MTDAAIRRANANPTDDEVEYVRTFTYTICCDRTTCDTAPAIVSSPQG